MCSFILHHPQVCLLIYLQWLETSYHAPPNHRHLSILYSFSSQIPSPRCDSSIHHKNSLNQGFSQESSLGIQELLTYYQFHANYGVLFPSFSISNTTVKTHHCSCAQKSTKRKLIHIFHVISTTRGKLGIGSSTKMVKNQAWVYRVTQPTQLPLHVSQFG